jgi:hypothetical protein
MMLEPLVSGEQGWPILVQLQRAERVRDDPGTDRRLRGDELENFIEAGHRLSDTQQRPSLGVARDHRAGR